jgi:hypothetical protein
VRVYEGARLDATPLGRKEATLVYAAGETAAVIGAGPQSSCVAKLENCRSEWPLRNLQAKGDHKWISDCWLQWMLPW